MAVPSGTFQTYQQIGIREDLSDIIAMISPTATPFYQLCKKLKADNTTHEWQTDVLASAVTTNYQVEGDDTTSDTATPTVRLKNYTQIFKKQPQVSGTGRSVNTAGRDDDLDYQVMKRTKEIKRDIESSLTQNVAAVAGNASTARRLASFELWLATNNSHGAGGSTGAISAGLPGTLTDGTQRAVSTTLMNTVLAAVFTAGGEVDKVMVGPGQKQAIAALAGGTGTVVNRIDLGKKTAQGALMTGVDTWSSDFGVLDIVPNRFQRNRTAFFLTSDMISVATLRPISREALAKTGDSDKVQVIGELTLHVDNEAAHGKVADLN